MRPLGFTKPPLCLAALALPAAQSTASRQQSISASASASVTIGAGASGSFSASSSRVNANFASVTEQSGLKAGDGGFAVTVGGSTDLQGAVIASNQGAVDNHKNSFTTGGTLTTGDLQNSDRFEGKSAGLSIGAGKTANSAGLQGTGIGLGSSNANASSTTTAGISGITGDTAVRSTDAQTGLARQFDADKVQRQISAQTQITQTFSQEAPKAVASYANEKLRTAQAKGDQAGVDQWKEGGTARVALHALVGGLGGGAGGALGAATSQTLVPLLGDEIAKLDIPVELKQALVAAAGVAVGAATGGVAGAASGLTATTNNYLTAAELRSKEQKLKGCRAQGSEQCEVNVLKDYDLLSAKNSGEINHKTVMSELFLKGEKDQLEQLLLDPQVSDAGKAEARKSIAELNVAINVIQKSPVLRDAAELGLLAADVALLGELALARTLGSAAVKALIASRTGKEIADTEAARIANSFYRDGAQFTSNMAKGRPLANLRLEYEQAARDLATQSNRMLSSGATEEQVARWAVEQRNQLKVVYRDLTPPEMIPGIEARNILEYKNPLGPSIDQLRAKGKSWQEIIESSARPGGGDIDLSPAGFWRSK